MSKVLGIDVGGTKIASALFDQENNIISRNKINTEAEKGKEVILSKIFQSIDLTLQSANNTVKDLSGIGIALPGPVDSDNGISHTCANLKDWENVEISKILQDRYNTPVFLENDARAAALGEAVFGAGKDFNSFVYVCVSTGIGCGIIINKELYKGADGGAGELSHIVFEDGSSLHSHASGNALKNLFSISGIEIQQLCESGNPDAISAFDYFINYLGLGISNVVTLLNPEAVIIGGGMANMDDFLFTPLTKKVRKHAFSVAGENVQLIKAQFSNDAGVLGLSSLVTKELSKAC